MYNRYETNGKSPEDLFGNLRSNRLIEIYRMEKRGGDSTTGYHNSRGSTRLCIRETGKNVKI